MMDDVTDVIATVLDLAQERVSDTLTAADVKSWDSITTVRIALALEERLGVSFTPNEIVMMQSVAAVRTSCVAAKKRGERGS